MLSFKAVLALVFLLSPMARADSIQVNQVEKTKVYTTDFGLDYMQIGTTRGTAFTSVGPSVRLIRALADKWAVSVGLHQGFSTGGFTAVFTSWDLDAEYAITGRQMLAQEEVKVGEWSVFGSKATPQGGFTVAAGISQVLLTGSTSVVVFTGINGIARYVYDTGSLRYFLALQLSQVSSGTVTLTPMALSVGAAVWF